MERSLAATGSAAQTAYLFIFLFYHRPDPPGTTRRPRVEATQTRNVELPSTNLRFVAAPFVDALGGITLREQLAGFTAVV